MSTTEELKDFLVESRLIRSDQVIDENESLVESGIIDSIGMMELVDYIKNNYGIIIKESDLITENFDSLSSIKKLISNRLSTAK